MTKVLWAVAILIIILAIAILLSGCKSWKEQVDECSAKGGAYVKANEGSSGSGYICIKVERL